MGRDCVSSLRVNIDILAVLQDLDVLDAVRAVDGDEHGFVVALCRGLDRGVDGVLQAGNLQEAAHFTNGVLPVGVGGHGVAGRPFESVDDFLTGRFDDAERVAVWMDLDDLAVSDIACGDIGTDTAAVDEGDVSAGNGAVRVGAEVAEVGFAVADSAGAVGALRGQVDGGSGDNGVDKGFILFLNGLDKRVGRIVLGGVVGDKLRGEHAVGDGQLADVDELRARGGQGDLLAVLVLDQLHGNGGMGVAVEHGVDAGGVGDQVGRAPRLGGFVNAQMCKGDNVGRAVLLGSVNGFLHLVIKVSTLVALREGVDEIAVGVLEVGRGGLGEGFGRIDADERDLDIAVGLDLIRLVAGQTLAVLACVGQVAAQVLILGLVNQLLKLRQGVVKFVVAEGSKIIADFIHNIDQIFTLGQRADDVALHGVAAINERNVVIRGLHLLFVSSQTGIADVVVNGAVHVVGVQNHNVVGFLVCCERCGHKAQHQACRQQKCNQFLHSILPLHLICPWTDGMFILYYKEPSSAIHKCLKSDVRFSS